MDQFVEHLLLWASHGSTESMNAFLGAHILITDHRNQEFGVLVGARHAAESIESGNSQVLVVRFACAVHDCVEGAYGAAGISDGFQGHEDGLQLFGVILTRAVLSEGDLQERFGFFGDFSLQEK